MVGFIEVVMIKRHRFQSVKLSLDYCFEAGINGVNQRIATIRPPRFGGSFGDARGQLGARSIWRHKVRPTLFRQDSTVTCSSTDRCYSEVLCLLPNGNIRPYSN